MEFNKVRYVVTWFRKEPDGSEVLKHYKKRTQQDAEALVERLKKDTTAFKIRMKIEFE